MDLATLRKKMRPGLAETVGNLRQQALEHAPHAVARREAGYTIANADDVAIVRIYDEIWWLGVNAEDLARELDDITAPEIRVEINSPGGDVFDGIAIYNALRNHPARVTTRIDGIAASIASVVAQAGDHRIMLSASQMMIHNAWGVTIGDHHDHEEMRGLLEQQDDIIAGIYAARSGGDRDHFRTLMDAETYLSDERAVDEGLADEVVDPPRKDDPQDRAPSGTQDKTLHDEISEAMDVVSGALTSAERVAALRAEAGKSLSNVNVDSLVGLRDTLGQLEGLLSTENPNGDLANELYAQFIATSQEMTA